MNKFYKDKNNNIYLCIYRSLKDDEIIYQDIKTGNIVTVNNSLYKPLTKEELIYLKEEIKNYCINRCIYRKNI